MGSKETIRYGYLELDEGGVFGWVLSNSNNLITLDSMCEIHEHKFVEIRIREIKEAEPVPLRAGELCGVEV